MTSTRRFIGLSRDQLFVQFSRFCEESHRLCKVTYTLNQRSRRVPVVHLSCYMGHQLGRFPTGRTVLSSKYLISVVEKCESMSRGKSLFDEG